MKITRYISLFVVFLTILCGYSWSIYHTSTGGDKLGPLGKPLIKFASFPQFVEEVLNSPEVNNLPETFLPIDTTFKPINNLGYDLFGLTAFWENKTNHWEIELLNFRNDSVLNTWYFYKKNYEKYQVQFSNSPPKHMVLLDDKELVVRLTMSPNLFRLDSNSNVVWHNKELEFHHSLNFDPDGSLWACASDVFQQGSEIYTGGLVKNLDGNLISFREDYIVKIDVATGEILFKKGVAKILLENGYKSIVYGADLFDPMHINDIQPVLEDSEYWKKGDLFICLRNRSLVYLYRPSTNKIIKLIQGPFINQHDVDIISDTEISIFNNNHISAKGFDCKDPYMEMDSLNSSEIIIYNFETDTYRTHLKEVFLKEGIVSKTQGISEFLSNGDVFVEEQNAGIYHVINDSDVVMRKVFYTPDSNYVHMPNWVRIFETNPLLKE